MLSKTYTVRDLPLTERPRERLQNYGAEALSLSELLAIVLGRGMRGESVLMLSQKIIAEFGHIDQLSDASMQDLLKIKGLGVAKAAQLKACLELARRLQQSTGYVSSNTIISPAQIFEYISPKIIKFAQEHFLVISLDTRNKIIGSDTITIGTLSSSLVHPRETFEAAIKRHAACIVVAHNHPSGDPEPSSDDIEVTSRLTSVGKLMGIELHDHIIITKDKFFSFKDEGLI